MTDSQVWRQRTTFHQLRQMNDPRGKYLTCIIALDLMIGPATSLLSTQMSVYIVAALFVANLWTHFRRISIPQAILLASVLASTLLAILVGEHEPLQINDRIVLGGSAIDVENMKRCAYLFMASTVYLVMRGRFASEATGERGAPLSLAITAVLGCYLLLATIFELNDEFFEQIRGAFFNVPLNAAADTAAVDPQYAQRYSFILLDPNNSGYFILLVGFFALEKLSSTLPRVMAVGAVIAAPLLSQSAGVLTTLLVYGAVRSLFAKDRRRIAFCSVALVAALLAASALPTALVDPLRRLGLFTRISQPEHLASDRTDKYAYVLTRRTAPLIGSGYLLSIDGELFRPHSDHLRFVYSYGLISYLALLAIVVGERRRWRSYTFALPACAAFTTNSLIDETRLLYTAMLLLAAAAAGAGRHADAGGDGASEGRPRRLARLRLRRKRHQA